MVLILVLNETVLFVVVREPNVTASVVHQKIVNFIQFTWTMDDITWDSLTTICNFVFLL